LGIECNHGVYINWQYQLLLFDFIHGLSRLLLMALHQALPLILRF
jgi:hypothetical protein